MQTPNEITAVLERMLPVGSIVEWAPVEGGKADLSSADKVAAYYGFGTWEAYGSGQMLLGVSDSHAVGSTGGEAEHTLTRSELPLYAYCFVYGAPTDAASNKIAYFNTTSGRDIGFGRAKLGDGSAHNNMPPYITVYRWRRTA